jgi:Family of unknown function (DUF6515)
MKNSTNTLLTVKKLLIMAAFALLLPFQQLSAQAKRPAGNKPAAAKPAANKPSVNKPDAARSNGNKPDARSNGNDRNGSINNSGNKTNNINGGNKVNIDNSKKNVNVNIDNSKNVHVNNSRNTAVRRNTRPYPRPPYAYGGYRYRCYNPYVFHPYRPFVWGPMWHPWGFFIATLATTAILISIVDNDMDLPGQYEYDMAFNSFSVIGLNSIEKQLLLSEPTYKTYAGNHGYTINQYRNGGLAIADQYYYDQGVFYLKGDGGYTVVSAPLGAKIKTLPTGYETVTIDENGTKNYYYGGAFFEKRTDGYVVVAPLAGTVVEHVSDGGEEVKMGDITYVKMGETYYQPIQKDGKDMYEVADVEEDK